MANAEIWLFFESKAQLKLAGSDNAQKQYYVVKYSAISVELLTEWYVIAMLGSAEAEEEKVTFNIKADLDYQKI